MTGKSTFGTQLTQLQAREDIALAMGVGAKLENREASGHLNTRERIAQLKTKMERDTSTYALAAAFGVQAVIDPRAPDRRTDDAKMRAQWRRGPPRNEYLAHLHLIPLGAAP